MKIKDKMKNIAIYFDNNLEINPLILVRQNGVVKVIRKVSSLKLLDGTITLGYQDTIDSLRRLNSINNYKQKRIEVLFGLNIGYAKSDEPKKWKFSKQDIIANYIENSFLKKLRNYESGNILLKDFFNEVIDKKHQIIEAVDKKYNELNELYSTSENRKEWLNIEYEIDSYFLSNQFNGIKLDNNRINNLLKELNYQKYRSLYYLEKNHGIDIAGDYISERYINKLVLKESQEYERTDEISELLQVLNEDNEMIEAIRTVRECKIDYSNLIRHYSLNENQLIYPQYDTIGSSSGRIFISSPGTQYLKKSKRDIFVPNEGWSLKYFDFRNYEPGITAGLSGDQDFIDYYNSGDMYSRISTEYYNSEDMRKNVKISVLASLYGMSEDSLIKYFKKTNNFNPGSVIELLKSFSSFQKWKNDIIKESLKTKEAIQDVYTRKFLPNKEWKVNTSAVNHIIQSTGSMILKKCINEVIKISGVRVLVPMHDALLCEIHDENIESLSQQVSEIMEETFLEKIEKAKSKIVIGSFSE